ncbi:MAG TPA: PKD domain-containing protein, partial [Chitinophagaceae bacterium]
STLIFSGFLGGNANDAAYVLSLSQDGSIYVAGGTESGNFPGTGSGAIHNNLQGGIDGYVSIINPAGSAITKSTYLGTSSYDQVYGIQFDRLGFPYVMGQTTGAWSILNATWSQSGGKQFIAKLQPDLSAYVYSTVFGSGGSSPDISPVAFLVDRCENVYVSGWGGDIGITGFSLMGTSGLTRVNGVLQSWNDGREFYFFVLKKNASAQLYGDFFGQNGGFTDHVDGGTSRFDANGMIYQAICANCGGGPYPTGPSNVWALTHSSPNCNLAMLKVDMDLSGIRSGVQSAINGVVRDSAGCVPLTVDFRDTILNAVSYEWNFGDGSSQITTNTPNASHTYNAVGSYQVMLVAIDSTSCNIRDTSYITIRVGELQALPDFNINKLQPCDSFKFRFDNITVAPPVRPFRANSVIWDFGDGSPRRTTGPEPVFHNYAGPGTYIVKLYLVDTGYCNAPDSIIKTVRVASVVKAAFEPPSSGCEPLTIQLENTSEGGLQFLWNFGDGTTSTEENPTHTFSPGTYTISLVAIDSATCNISDSTSVTITVYPSPQALFDITSPQPPPVNTPITFNNLSSPDAVRFKWLFGDGDSLVTVSRALVQHEYNATTTYDACLLAYNAQGCVDTFCRQVVSVVEPAVDVPNAFTPLSGDINSVVMVRGFAIGKMKFIIWNRWGQKVFETDTNKVGWDGTFKGKLQPMDVYVYTLEVEFTDGTKASKRGDITLIR